MNHLISCVDALFENKTVGNLIVRVGRWEEILIDLTRTAQDRRLSDHTLFDMASVTKIMATTTLALMAMGRGLLSPEDKVSRFFPVPEDKQCLTVKHLMPHTMGIGHKNLTGCAGGYADIARYILDIPADIPIGTDVRYSCPGFILLGCILEKLFDRPLNEAFDTLVAAPLGLESTAFLPNTALDFVNANRSAADVGIVNDYNCRYLGGVCGNAGVFSCLEDVTRFVRLLLARGHH